MKRQGFHRWLLAYLPIFFIIISLLILIFFFAMSSYSKQQTTLANEVFAQNVLHAVDSSLQFTEQMIIKELITDEKLRLFYDVNQELTPFQYFEVSRRIANLAIAFPPVQSIYLYRLSDHKILTSNAMVPLEGFRDRAFIDQVMSKSMSYAWTESRIYQEFERDDSKKSVVSMTKRVPLGSGSQGLLVINVMTSAIEEMLNNLSESNIYINLTDSNNKLLYGERLSSHKQLSQIKSSYTGWVIQSGLKSNMNFNIVSVISNVWLILGFFTVLVGTIWMIFSVHRNYKPIELIKNRIQLYASQKNSLLSNKPTGDEFNFISTSIERIIEISNSHEQNHQENLIFRKRWFFDELIEGDRSINLEECQQEMKRLGLSDQIDQLAIVILEIDQYADFCSNYSHSDQQLLKFSVASVIKEIALNQGIQTWNEWVSNNHIAILVILSKDDVDAQLTVLRFCESMRCWIEENLKFTVSFGIGSIVSSLLEASQSNNNALEALQFKTTFGMNKTIGYWEIDGIPHGQIYRYLTDSRLIAQHYRLGEEEWKQHLNQLFIKLKTVISPRDEIVSLMNYIIFTIQKEMTSLSVEMSTLWERSALPQLNHLLNRFDVLEEIEIQFFEILNTTAVELNLLREKRDNHQLIRQVRQYIFEHYANPDLSLNHLSEEFNLNTKSVSRIFKEVFGENFVDYLTKVRIEQAKDLFVTAPHCSIQEIAQKVGYNHSISFIRVFKKIEGMTPGDYRKDFSQLRI